MALTKNTGSMTYLRIRNGAIVRNHKEPIEGITKTRISKTGKTVHEEFFKSLEATITSIEAQDSEYGKNWEIKLSDGDDKYMLSFPYQSGNARSFFMRLPNVNLSQPVKLAPWTMDDKNGKDLTYSGIAIYQGGKKIEPFFTKENMGDMPERKQIKVKGKIEMDDTDMMEYCEGMVKKMFSTPEVVDEEAPF